MKSILNVNVIKIKNDQKIEGIQIRSKCNWYKDLRKTFNFFSECRKKLSHLKPNTFSKNRWKGNKRSNEIIAKSVSVLWRVIF